MTTSRRNILKGSAAAVATLAASVPLATAALSDPLVILWQKLKEARADFRAASGRHSAAFNALPEEIRRPRVDVVTLTGQRATCFSEAELRELYSKERQRHPRQGTDAWSPDLRAAHDRTAAIDFNRTSDEDRAALKHYHRLSGDHDAAICREIRDDFNAWKRRLEEAQAAAAAEQERHGVDTLEEQEDALYERYSAIERQIIETPASTIAGAAVKLRLAAKYIIDATPSDEPLTLDGCDWGEVVTVSASADLDRLLGEADSAARALVARNPA